MSELNNLPFICLEFRDRDVYPKASSLKEALEVGAEIQAKEKAALVKELQERYEINKLSTEPPEETNRLFLKSMQDTLQKNILSLKELSEFKQNNKTATKMFNIEQSAFLNNLKKAHSLNLLKVIPNLKEESDIKPSIFTSGEIKLHHSIDPSYSSANRVRSRLYFMLMNNENSQSSSKPILRIFSDEGNHQNPFYHFNVEFTDTPSQNKTAINSLFRNQELASNLSIEKFNGFINYFAHEGLPDELYNLPSEVKDYYQNPDALNKTNNQEIRQQLNLESRDEHDRLSKLLQKEDYILEYLLRHKLKKTSLAIDNLNLLKSINELLSVQKNQPIVRSGQIQSGDTFNGRPFYIDKLFNTSRKPLDFHTGFISTQNLEIQFLAFDSKEKETIPKLNLKLTDKMRGNSTRLVLDAETDPDLKDCFKEYIQTFLSSIKKQESQPAPKLNRPNSRPK